MDYVSGLTERPAAWYRRLNIWIPGSAMTNFDETEMWSSGKITLSIKWSNKKWASATSSNDYTLFIMLSTMKGEAPFPASFLVISEFRQSYLYHGGHQQMIVEILGHCLKCPDAKRPKASFLDISDRIIFSSKTRKEQNYLVSWWTSANNRWNFRSLSEMSGCTLSKVRSQGFCLGLRRKKSKVSGQIHLCIFSIFFHWNPNRPVQKMVMGRWPALEHVR